MSRFFIADIHLNDNEPAITAGFLHFLNSLPNGCQLYILGDLFDYWIGDDVLSPLQQTVVTALSALKNRYIKTYFIHGNRDFLLGQYFAKQCNMQLLPATKCLKSDKYNILILHGDLLCTDDKAYQQFRRKMHNKWLQKLFLSLPYYFRQKIANKLRGKSQQHNRYKSQDIMDVNQNAVVCMIRNYQVDIMIHGHTHKPAVHHFILDNKPIKRIVLGAWHDGVSYIYQDGNGEVDLHYLPLQALEGLPTGNIKHK